VTLRMRLCALSAMKRLPAPSKTGSMVIEVGRSGGILFRWKSNRGKRRDGDCVARTSTPNPALPVRRAMRAKFDSLLSRRTIAPARRPGKVGVKTIDCEHAPVPATRRRLTTEIGEGGMEKSRRVNPE